MTDQQSGVLNTSAELAYDPKSWATGVWTIEMRQNRSDSTGWTIKTPFRQSAKR
ncbi:hypothetical protein [Planococcus salinarum]|uniref:hypothetical protein n=1 Tax=Planococcus salinarum TaxID=622695 RepID=UPI0012B68502|nr:hypothetical protein [Planococcus salinarum]